MLTMILTLNGWAEGWLRVMGAVLWQSTVLVALAILVACWLRRSSPAARYWLWQIVAIKLLLMPFWTSAVPLPSWAQSRPPRQSAAFQPATGLTQSGRAPARHLARARARQAAGSGLGMAHSDRADGLLLPPAGLLGGLSVPPGAGTGLRPTGHGPQRASSRRLRPDPGSGDQPRIRAGGRAGRSHFRRPDGQPTTAETRITTRRFLTNPTIPSHDP